MRPIVTTPFERRRGPFTVSTDPQRLDLEAVHAFLAHESYWARGIARDVFERAAAHSLCFGLYDGEAQIGFARVISDCATYAYLDDVYVLARYRGQGLGGWLTACVVEHPDLQGLRRFGLTTRDGQPFYERFGFQPLYYPERHMEKLPAGYYTRVA